jgi:hypothetical protein
MLSAICSAVKVLRIVEDALNHDARSLHAPCAAASVGVPLNIGQAVQSIITPTNGADRSG